MSLTDAALAGAEPVRKIDCQSRLFSDEVFAYLEKRKTSPYVYRKGSGHYVVVGEWHRRLMPRHNDVAAGITDLDKAGIAMAALTINDPGPELFDREFPAIARALNDFIGAALGRQTASSGWLSVGVFDFKPDGETMARRSYEFLRRFEEGTEGGNTT